MSKTILSTRPMEEHMKTTIEDVVDTTVRNISGEMKTTTDKLGELEKKEKNIKRELNRQERKIRGISKESRNNTETNKIVQRNINELYKENANLRNTTLLKKDFEEFKNIDFEEMRKSLANMTTLLIFIYLLVFVITGVFIFIM